MERRIIWPFRALIAFIFAVLLITSLQLLFSPDARQALIMQPTILGMETVSPSVREPFWRDVDTVQPDGPAEEAGIAAGDTVYFHQYRSDTQQWSPGEKVRVTVKRDGERFSTAITARAPEPIPEGSLDSAVILANVINLLSIAFAVLLVVRGRHNRLALMMAAMLVLMPGAPIELVIPIALVVPATLLTFIIFQNIAMACLWPIFCLELTGGPSSRRQIRLVVAALAFLSVVSIWASLVPDGLLPSFGMPMNMVSAGFVILDQLIGYAIIAANYHRTDPATRNRIKIILGAFIALMFAYSLTNSGLLPSIVNLLIVNSMYLVALSLLTYSILKQRLFDLGFAINRTLVYGAAAFTLLVIFGLVEYIAKSMIPVAWPAAGPFISAGLAVILFLMFHRLHHWFEHHIEHFFFKEWQEAEHALKRFVASASHFEKVSALTSASVDAVAKFAGGSETALYLRESDGSYRLAAGKLEAAPDSFAEDSPAFALMKAERQPLDLYGNTDLLPGELALPMLEQGVLAGFVLLGRKADGTHYRPDQVELLDWATHQIGLDLRALHARQLEAEVGRLADANRVLTGERDRLADLLDRSQPA